MATSKRCAGITFEIKAGEVFGLLGPNGAGKTTTIEILEGLRQADSGSVRCAAWTLLGSRLRLRNASARSSRATVLPDKIRVEEALDLVRRLLPRSRSVEMLLEQFGLREKRRAFFEKLSGGQKQRLALALAMVNNPELVLLDEPTVGLDAQLRRDIYALIERFREERRTTLLTTHYIEEAERLCDRVAIIDHGQVIALGTPRELVAHPARARASKSSLPSPFRPGSIETAGRRVGLPRGGREVFHARSARRARRWPRWCSFSKRKAIPCSTSTSLSRRWKTSFVEMTGRKMED